MTPGITAEAFLCHDVKQLGELEEATQNLIDQQQVAGVSWPASCGCSSWELWKEMNKIIKNPLSYLAVYGCNNKKFHLRNINTTPEISQWTPFSWCWPLKTPFKRLVPDLERSPPIGHCPAHYPDLAAASFAGSSGSRSSATWKITGGETELFQLMSDSVGYCYCRC